MQQQYTKFATMLKVGTYLDRLQKMIRGFLDKMQVMQEKKET